MPQSVQGDWLSPSVKDKPRYRCDAPPREVSEDDLQVDKQLAHLRIDRRNVKRHRKVKVIGKEAQYDTYEIEMERPQYEPTYP